MRRLLVSLALVASTLGCGSDATETPPLAEIVGSYSLASVNGSILPFTYAVSGADKAEVLDDVITLREDGAWTEVWHDRYTMNGVVTTEEMSDEGAYSRVGNRITLTSAFGGAIVADVANGKITMSGNGFSLIYSR
jgi:hypothetical protein